MNPSDSRNQSRPNMEEIAWVMSPEGEEALKEARARSGEIIEKLEEARKIDPKILQEPMDF